MSHNGALVKKLLDEAFLILQPDSPEDNPSEPHLRSVLGKTFWKILDGGPRIEDRFRASTENNACAVAWITEDDFDNLIDGCIVKISRQKTQRTNIALYTGQPNSSAQTLTDGQLEAVWRLAAFDPLHLFIRDVRALLNTGDGSTNSEEVKNG